jgi:FkbM family methyltransferase
MRLRDKAFFLANGLYSHAYPLYYPLYSAWKAFADRRERAVLKSIIRPGMTVADVGANIGIYTRFFAQAVGGTGAVHAFEPAPDNFRRLRATTRGLNNVTVTQSAVGDVSGKTRLYLSPQLNVDHQTFDSGEGRVSVDVPLISLDDYFIGREVHVIKIDVQGFEMKVLKGALRTLQQSAGITVLMELWPYGLQRAGTDPHELLVFLEKLGFKITPILDEPNDSVRTLLSRLSKIDQYCNVVVARP